jgi:hypothetical protein
LKPDISSGAEHGACADQDESEIEGKAEAEVESQDDVRETCRRPIRTCKVEDIRLAGEKDVQAPPAAD